MTFQIAIKDGLQLAVFHEPEAEQACAMSGKFMTRDNRLPWHLSYAQFAAVTSLACVTCTYAWPAAIYVPQASALMHLTLLEPGGIYADLPKTASDKQCLETLRTFTCSAWCDRAAGQNSAGLPQLDSLTLYGCMFKVTSEDTKDVCQYLATVQRSSSSSSQYSTKLKPDSVKLWTRATDYYAF